LRRSCRTSTVNVCVQAEHTTAPSPPCKSAIRPHPPCAHPGWRTLQRGSTQSRGMLHKLHAQVKPYRSRSSS
jgi:hypothetical protein